MLPCGFIEKTNIGKKSEIFLISKPYCSWDFVAVHVKFNSDSQLSDAHVSIALPLKGYEICIIIPILQVNYSIVQKHPSTQSISLVDCTDVTLRFQVE